MKEETLKRGNEILEEIIETENCVDVIKKQEWVSICFENENLTEHVCDDPEIIQKVRDLIVLESELKLDRLRTEFKNL